MAAVFAEFDNVWNVLSPREQAEVLRVLIARVDFDADDSAIEVSFHASGIKKLGVEASTASVEDAA